MEIKGIDFAFVTMHCGLGNFREIDVEDLTKHKMDSEEMFVSAEACRIVNQAKDSGHKICAVGTTVRTAYHRIGSRNRLSSERVPGMDQQIYLPSLRIQCGRFHGGELLSALQHPVDADSSLRWLRTGYGSL